MFPLSHCETQQGFQDFVTHFILLTQIAELLLLY